MISPGNLLPLNIVYLLKNIVQLGKIQVKVSLEFCSDEPEEEREEKESSLSEYEAENSGSNNSEYLETDVSRLDDLRQKFHQENQQKISGGALIYVGYFLPIHIFYSAKNKKGQFNMENQYKPLETNEVIQIDFSPIPEELGLSSNF